MPLASSCGRLFDAVAAAMGLCADRAIFEGQGAMELEAITDPSAADPPYPFAISEEPTSGLLRLESSQMWEALLVDLARQTPVVAMAARFHGGLARAIRDMVDRIRGAGETFDTVVLSGGCVQNKLLCRGSPADVGDQRAKVSPPRGGSRERRRSRARAGGRCGGETDEAVGSIGLSVTRVIEREERAMCLGIPGQVVEITDVKRQLAIVDVSGVHREVSLECVVEPHQPLASCVGHWVLVHVGFAMSVINEEEAAATLKILSELGEVQAELAAMKASGAGLAQPVLRLAGTSLCKKEMSMRKIKSTGDFTRFFTAKSKIRWR